MAHRFISKFNVSQQLKGIATPISSIFGSGFLVIVSVLAESVGPYSFWAMLGICVLAYGVGGVIRFNIRHAEPLFAEGRARPVTIGLERIADIALVPAYVISVALYINILSSYAMGFANIPGHYNERMMTSSIILFILFVGLTRGLKMLEGLEKIALDATMAIITLIIAAFAVYNISRFGTGELRLPDMPGKSGWEILTILGGTLIVVQGFETTRYLGHQYDAETRIRACRNSQLISAAVYLLLIAVATPLMHYLPKEIVEDGLMLIAAHVAVWLPAPLVFAAIFSQFSAATADIIGASGNMLEFTRRKLTEKANYVIICAFALVLTWVSDTMHVLALASRAFAFYYFIQALIAFTVATQSHHRIAFAVLAAVLLFIVIFAVPVG